MGRGSSHTSVHNHLLYIAMLVVGGYSGGTFLFRSFGFGSGGGGLYIPRNLSSVFFV